MKLNWYVLFFFVLQGSLTPYSHAADQPVSLSFAMLPVNGQMNSVYTGANPCFAPSNLSFSTNHEWSTEFYDGTRPAGRFIPASCTPLPITLLVFLTTVENKKVKLTWTTGTELDNDRFEIERSKDGLNFTKIGKVASKGNSTDTQEYFFYDEQPLSGKTFYRLRQIDIDANSKFTNIRLILFDDPRTFVVYPNPVSESGILNIWLKDKIRGSLKIVVYDMSGSQVYAETKINVQNNFQVKTGLATGIYTMHLITGERSSSQKIVIMK